ncbi:MAG: N-acetylmuramate alpha-1-phosphate uridylyltransferase MurU [Cellvibrio sp.]
MKAMILAAGLGQRMRPLTNYVPKPLLAIKGVSLIDYHLHKLADAGFSEVIINHAHLGHKITEHCGNGDRYGLSITYSAESPPLETGGAILKVMDILGNAPFVLINGDVYSDYPLGQLKHIILPETSLGCLIMVNNPDFHPLGDFAITANGTLSTEGSKLTYSGIAVLDPDIINSYPQKRTHLPLGEVFRYWITNGRLCGQFYDGLWSDVGTPQRLVELAHRLTTLKKFE